jgi:NAD(P)-dependent dehydrogenase (short-subunit alcohol dehydrogenase family)
MPVAIITGGTSWMAQETAKKLLDNDWDIIMCSRKSDNVVDVTDAEAVNNFFASAISARGQIDAVVNIAGGLPSMESAKQLFHETSKEDFDATMMLNFNGVVNTTRAIIPHFLEQKKGNIVSIISGSAFKGFPRMSAYSASKAAVNTFTQSIAQEYGMKGIRANTILPGFTENRWNANRTKINAHSAMGRNTTPVDVANMIFFLLSDESAHVTGSCFDLSGGAALH